MSQSPFSIRVGALSPEDLRVVSFRGREAISELFSFRLVVHATPELAGHDADLLGARAVFTLASATGVARRVEALIDDVRVEASTTPRAAPTWHLRLVPPLAILRRRVTSRIFQEKTVPEIIEAVLRAAGVPVELRLARAYPPRVYCVQYRESDLAFVRRIAAEEGIAFCFADAPDAPSSAVRAPVIFLDDPGFYIAAPTTVYLRPDDGLAPTGAEILSFTRRRALKPRSVHIREYDFRRPSLTLFERAVAGERADAGEPAEAIERTAAPERAAPDLEVYEHHADDTAPNVSPERARALLQQVQRRAVLATGESWVKSLAPGRRFELRSDTSAGLDGSYAVTRVTHEGHTPELSGRPPERTYKNSFECVPAATLLRPRPAPRRPMQVLETATVTGPAEHEVHTDEHARVKVQFHWDLDGKRDEHSSVWLRVAQSWAGASFGAQFIPRVGMEVLVGFLGGDTDCPVVLGCLYNATHPPPFPLPAEKLKSGLRTQSSPGAGGANELSFDDRAGEEQIYLFAERNLDEVIQRDHSTMVGRDQSVTIQGSHSLVVSRDQTAAVLGQRTEKVTGSAIERIEGSRLATVAGSQDAIVSGDSTSIVGRDLTVEVKGRAGLTVGDEEAETSATLDVRGDLAAAVTDSVRVKATRSLRLSCGASAIELTEAEIKLEGPAITILGGGSVSLIGKGPAFYLTDKALVDAKAITIKTPQAFLKLDEDASLQGKLVKLNCDKVEDAERDEEAGPPPKAFRVRVADVFEKPYARKKYKLVVDGTPYEGETTEDGMVEQDLPPTAETGHLTVWINKPDEEPTLKWRLTLGDLPPMETPHGVRLRLKNLGYYRVAEGQTEGAEVAAIRAFQRDQGLADTGVFDDETKSRLAAAHGH